MNNFTERERKLCELLHKMGVRPEIQFGDFYVDVYGRPTLMVYASRKDHPYAGEIDFLLWSWSRAREWLREKNYYVGKLDFWSSGIDVVFIGPNESRLDGHGQTDLEAILKACVKVAEEEA